MQLDCNETPIVHMFGRRSSVCDAKKVARWQFEMHTFNKPLVKRDVYCITECR